MAAPRRTAREAALWRRGLLVICVLLVALATVELVLTGGEIQRPFRLGYGIGAAILLGVVLLYAVRRRAVARASRWRLGSAARWLRLHVYGGALFFVLVLLHTGFSLPLGALNWALWLSSLLAALTGFVGLVLQRWIPRVLASGLSVEVLYERVPELVDEIRAAAEELVAGANEPVQVLYQGQIASLLAAPQRRAIYYLDITGGIRSRLKEFRHLHGFLGEGERQKLDELEKLLRTKLEIDAHYTLQQPLRLWLFVHVPVSLILAALVVIHLFQVLYY